MSSIHSIQVSKEISFSTFSSVKYDWTQCLGIVLHIYKDWAVALTNLREFISTVNVDENDEYALADSEQML